MVLFGIITYKEKFYECKSFLSLLASFDASRQSDITVFVIDNTDTQDWSVNVGNYKDRVKVIYRHFPDNPGISYGYNKINQYASKNGFEWVVFLDQDTILPQDSFQIYLRESQINSNPIKLPKVWANNKLLSPCWYVFHRSFQIKGIAEKYIATDKVSCINTGIMISTDFFLKVGGYNENLRIDLCDHEFILRAKKKLQHFYIMDIDLDQDFSANTNNLEQDLSRYKHFIKDLKSYSFGKQKVIIFLSLDLLHCLKLTYKHKTLEFIKQRFLRNIL